MSYPPKNRKNKFCRHRVTRPKNREQSFEINSFRIILKIIRKELIRDARNLSHECTDCCYCATGASLTAREATFGRRRARSGELRSTPLFFGIFCVGPEKWSVIPMRTQIWDCWVQKNSHFRPIFQKNLYQKQPANGNLTAKSAHFRVFPHQW